MVPIFQSILIQIQMDYLQHCGGSIFSNTESKVRVIQTLQLLMFPQYWLRLTKEKNVQHFSPNLIWMELISRVMYIITGIIVLWIGEGLSSPQEQNLFHLIHTKTIAVMLSLTTHKRKSATTTKAYKEKKCVSATTYLVLWAERCTWPVLHGYLSPEWCNYHHLTSGHLWFSVRTHYTFGSWWTCCFQTLSRRFSAIWP